MSSCDIEEIAKLHCKMFRLHDEQKWDLFRKNAEKYICALGYNEKQAKTASQNVVNAYQFADKAVIAQEEGNNRKEGEMYREAYEKHILAHSIIGANTRSVKYKIGWYRAARHKNHLGVLINLFMEHLSRFGWQKLPLVLKCTYITAFNAYNAHNSHDWEKLEGILRRYWSYILDYYKNDIKLPIEL